MRPPRNALSSSGPNAPSTLDASQPDRSGLRALAPLLAAAGVTRIADVTGLDRVGLPVAAAYRPNARSAVVSYGAAAGLETAKLAAAMEAIERFHAEQVMLPSKLGSMLDLSATHRLAEIGAPMSAADAAFDASQPYRWVEGIDLLQETKLWLPLDLVHLDRTIPSPASSSGLAAGFDAAGARCHALCELVERDAAANWFARPPQAQAATRIDLQTIQPGSENALLRQIAAAGLHIAVWDATSDIGVAVLLCNLVESGAGPLPPAASAWGMASHPDRNVALVKCLEEALQARLATIASVADDIGPADLAPIDGGAVMDRIEAVRQGNGQRPFHAVPTRPVGGPAGEIAWLLDRFKAAGFQHVIAIDLTRPEFGVAVVRIVVPGIGDIAAPRGARVRYPGLPMARR
ncbi:MAG: YcaO-like family protein [Dongiaceae bacterium]